MALVGAYSLYTCKISTEAKKAFEEAIAGLVGVNYSPVAVSIQIVAGTNYHFFCNATPVTAKPINGAAIVSVFAPLEGEAHITKIQNV